MSNIPISKTKITPPRRRPELLARKRLLDAFFDALDYRLVLVSAPAGYGKTSLLIDAVPLCEFKCCWLSLDELDREPRRFIAYLTACIAGQFPGYGSQIAEIMKSIVSLEGEIEQVAVMLVNEAYERIHEHFVLILDDFHILEGVQPIYDLMNRFVQLADDNCHIVISSRTLTPISDLPLMVAREQVRGLDFADLVFRKEELQALVLQNNHIHISDDDAQKLIDETEGWATGLQFSGSHFIQTGNAKPITGRGAGLFDYLGQQVLDRQKPELRIFLLQSSLLDEFDSALCERALAMQYETRQDWEGLIRAVLQNNLFAVPVGADGALVRYHHLFRDFLRAQMKKERPGEAAEIQKRLGRAYQDMGEWEKSYSALKPLGDMNALADMIERAGFLNMKSIGRVIETWLGDLPPSMRRSRPGILSALGVIKLTRGKVRESIEDQSRAIELFRREADVSNLAAALTRRAWAYRALGDYPSALRDSEEAVRLTEEKDEHQFIYAEALRTKGSVLHRTGRLQQSLPCYEQAYEVLARFDDKDTIPELLTQTASVHQILGNISESERTYDRVLKTLQQDGNLWLQAWLFNEIGNMHHQEGGYQKSARAYEEGLLAARRSSHARMEALISIGLGDLYAELQDFEVASQRYQHTEEMLGDSPDQFLQFALLNGRANLKFRQKDAQGLGEILHSMEEIMKGNDSHYENGQFRLQQGKWFLLIGRSVEAVAALEQAESRFEQSGHLLELAAARTWLSAAYVESANIEAFRSKIQQITGRNNGIPHVVLSVVIQSWKWLERRQKDEQSGRALRSLFARAEKVSTKLPSIRRELRWQSRAINMPAARLEIKGFGRALVKLDGRELGSSDWQTQSVRDLFFFFLSQSGPLSKEEAANIIWPELDDPSRIRLRFKNEMYRLRRAVGQDIIRFENAAYFFDRDIRYEYDVELFDSFLARAASAQTEEEQIEYRRKAVDLARGPYLQDIYFDWTMLDRERLKQSTLTALGELSEAYLRRAELNACLNMCERAIELDATDEAAYRFMIKVHHRRGDKPNIVRAYQACVEALRQLGVSPSAETRELYHALLA